MSIYKTYSPEQVENLLSDFLVNSWSYSRVTTFARHEKLFEMQYIYGYQSRMSSTTIAGQAYHAALDAYFTAKKEKENALQLTDLEIIAFEYIENVHANTWKIQKTTPTVDDCKQKATATVGSLLRNFYSELNTYEDDIEEVLDVEIYCDEFLTINGVDIPMPCHMKIDLIVQTKSGKIAIIDHKSKMIFTSEEEMQLSIGLQAITYVKGYESKTSLVVDEVWFVENKFSQNRDKSPQLNCFKILIDDDVRKLYEALLYEPLKRMITAVADPDYVYLINESDNFVDKAEIYDFWAKTMISEIDDFNVEESKKELVTKRLKKIRDASMEGINPKIIKNFKQNAASFIQYDLSHTNMTDQEKIQHVLRSFGTIVNVAHTFDGYSSNTYLLEVSAGVKITSIHGHKLDIANALNVPNVRISRELVMHDGKSFVAVEFSKKREKDLFFEPNDLVDLKIPIGKDNFDNVIYWDLNNHSTPHMLIGGQTGSGKSVSIRSTIEYAKLAGIEDIIILDPKYEFTEYASDGSVKVFNDILDIEEEMAALVEKMNFHVRTGGKNKTLIVFDEFADALASARKGTELDLKEMVQIGNYAPKKGFMGMMMPGEAKMALKKTGELKSLEENLRILVQKGRSVGFRVLAATQRASVKVITGDTKANFPVILCFRLPKEVDSKVMLDESGAELLQGKGDGLIKSPEYNEVTRFQAYFKQ